MTVDATISPAPRVSRSLRISPGFALGHDVRCRAVRETSARGGVGAKVSESMAASSPANATSACHPMGPAKNSSHNPQLGRDATRSRAGTLCTRHR